MAMRQVRCWTLVCDVCADGWTSDAGQPHFETRQEAKAHAVAGGWVVTPTRALCRECTESEVCAMAGHRWGRWTAAGPFPSRGGGAWQGRVRHCTLCSVADWDPPVSPPGEALGRTG